MGIVQVFAAALWALGTVGAAFAGGPLPWNAVALAAAMALVSLAVPDPWRGGALAIGAMPLWMGALQEPLGPLFLGLALVLGALPGPRAVAFLVAAVGCLEGARLDVLEVREILPFASSALLVVGGLVVGALYRGAPVTTRLGPLALGVAALIGIRPFVASARVPPTSDAEVDVAFRTGALPLHQQALLARPELGLHALQLRPTWHALAIELVPKVSIGRALASGWRPEDAPLRLAERIEAARWLESHGRGGEAERLLAHSHDTRAAWWLALFRRTHGWETEHATAAGAPGDVPVLPGEIETGWAFYQNGTQVLELHARTPLSTLVLEGRGEPAALRPSILVRLDARTERVTFPEGGEPVSLPMAIPVGPHRLSVTFDGDRPPAEGGVDTNVFVDRLRAF